MSVGYFENRPEDLTCSVFRSSADRSVWMCNVPLTDLHDGVQAARSLRTMKRYVEEMAAQKFQDTDGGTWTRLGEDLWEYLPRGTE